MKKYVLILMAVLCSAGCTSRVGVDGDCIGSLSAVSRLQTCDRDTCDFEPGERLDAVDRDGCEFVSWSDASCTDRRCEARNGLRAVFARRWWRLHVDASAAPDVSLTVGDERCGASCEHVVVAGARLLLRAVGDAGVRPLFSGDCTPLAAGECEAVGDRERFVTVTQTLAPPARLTVRVTGPGSVSVLGRTCNAQSTCSLEVEVGRRVSLLATPDNERVSMSWPGQSCALDSCEVLVNEDVDLLVEFRPRLRVEADGSGSVHLDGTELTPPVDLVVDAGSILELVATPAPGLVLAEFSGVDCKRPRDVETCRFDIGAGASITARFTRLIRSVTRSFAGEITDVIERDGGLLALGNYFGNGDFNQPFSNYVQSYVVRIESDGGVSRLSTSTVGGRTQNFVELPDGGLWVSVALESNRPDFPNLVLQWGAVDAGLPGPAPIVSFAARGVLAFDESAFEPSSASLWDYPVDTAKTTTGRGPLTLLPEGVLLSWVSASRAPDGGALGVSALALLDQQATIRSREEVNSITPIDLAPVGGAVMGVALHDPAQFVTTSCGMPTADRVPVVFQVDLTGHCGDWAPAPDAGGVWLATGPLARGTEQVFFTSHSFQRLPLRGPGTTITTGYGHLHAFSTAPAHLWTETLEPLITPSSTQLPTGVLPLDTFEWNGRVLAFFGAKGRGVSGFESSDGLRIRCDPTADEHMVVTLHDKATGRMEWGHCFLQLPESMGVSAWTISNGGNSGFNESPRFVRAFGGIAMTLKPSSTSLPASFAIGDLTVQFDRYSNYVLVVTPP